LGSEDDFSDTVTLARQFAAMSGHLEQLDRNLRLVNETVALHACFHLAVTPLLPAAAQEAACALGAERFEEFAAQMEKRVDQGLPLIQETIDRISAARAATSQGHLLEARFTETTISRGNKEYHNEDEAAAVLEKTAQSTRATGRKVTANLAANGSLILRVFLPFVTGYYVAYLFRSINAVPSLTKSVPLPALTPSIRNSICFSILRLTVKASRRGLLKTKSIQRTKHRERG